MNRIRRHITIILGLAAGVAILAWLWRCWCVFPWLIWNEVRLEPSFLLAHQGAVYALPAAGPVTTWIYGPLTVLLLLPATLATSAADALLTAGAINLLVVVGPVIAFCAACPRLRERPIAPTTRIAGALMCLALWPASSLQYIQADNAAVACGLLGNLALLRSTVRSGAVRWIAATAAIAAIAAKQTSLGIAIAQLIWIGWSEGWSELRRHAERLTIVGLLVAVVSVYAFGAEELWFRLVRLPSSIPWTDAPGTRLADWSPLLTIHLLVPAGILLIARNQVWRRGSFLSLGALCWIASLPLGVAALMKSGGAINSLQGLLYFLPAAVLAWLNPASAQGTRWRSLVGLSGVFIIAIARLAEAPTPVWRPLTAHLRQADTIISQLPQEVWMPWHPLVTYYREGRFDHVEDGLYVRLISGHPVSETELRAYLPPSWSAVALLRNSSGWGVAEHLIPPKNVKSDLGFWTLYSWVPEVEDRPSQTSR